MRPASLSLLAVLACLIARPLGAETLSLSVASDRTIYNRSVNTPIYLEAKIGSAVGAEAEADPVRNIALVLDGSASMAGDPMQRLRHAAAVVVGTLSERDIVSVVVFGSEVETVIPAQPREQVSDLELTLARIEPAGGSALYDALNQGAAQLRRHAAKSAVNHLILVTDGLATKGPREHGDFVKLVESLAGENVTLSTIGLGRDFSEDLLADLARTGHGRFHFAATPVDLGAALQAEFDALHRPCARDVTLQIEFGFGTQESEAIGWWAGQSDGDRIIYRFPVVYAGQEIRVLAATRYTGLGSAPKIALTRLRWRDVDGGTEHEVTKRLTVYLDGDSWASIKSIDREVLRAIADAVISGGLQRAIEQLDKGDQRRAVRELRRAREGALSLNNEIEDPVIAARAKILQDYLAEVQARGINGLDRKLLRSGLNNRFEIPTEDPEDQ